MTRSLIYSTRSLAGLMLLRLRPMFATSAQRQSFVTAIFK